MGFTTTTYPGLQKNIASRVSLLASDDGSDVDIPQDAEDTIVSEVLEELLTADVDKELPPKPLTSSSAVTMDRDRDGESSVPGQWR